METVLDIKIVGYYIHRYQAEPPDCICCHDADWGDVIIEGICGRCLLEAFFQLSDNKTKGE